jgi:hypothetical protein
MARSTPSASVIACFTIALFAAVIILHRWTPPDAVHRYCTQR